MELAIAVGGQGQSEWRLCAEGQGVATCEWALVRLAARTHRTQSAAGAHCVHFVVHTVLCALRVKNKVTFVRSTAQKFIIILLADSVQFAGCSLRSTLCTVHIVATAKCIVAGKAPSWRDGQPEKKGETKWPQMATDNKRLALIIWRLLDGR